MYSLRTSQGTLRLTYEDTNRLILFREISVGYSENHTKYVNTLCGGNEQFFFLTFKGSCTNTRGRYLKGSRYIPHFIL
jgi:hypothetical protein